ncbi:hypothetical protein Tco_0226692 [Tanacetum coccineum]
MSTTNKESIAAGTDNRPLMLEESNFDSWKIRIQRYISGKPNGKLIWNSIKNGSTPHPTTTDTTGEGEQQTQVIRKKRDYEFTEAENIKELADIQALYILCQRDRRHIFNTMNQTEKAQEILENVELLMQGSGLTEQQQKDILFDQYERFRANGNESIHDYFVRFHKLINDMKITKINPCSTEELPSFSTNLPSYCYEQHAMKTLSKMNQSSGNIDPLAYMAQATKKSSEPLLIHDPSYDYKRSRITTRMFNEETPVTKRLKLFGDVEGTTPYAKPLAITTTTTFEVSLRHDLGLDVDKHSCWRAAFMANLTCTSTGEGTNNDTDFHSEEHTHNNHFFENINHQVTQAMHQVDTTKDLRFENVPTEVSPVLSDQIYMITILDDMRLKLEGYMNTNKEQSLANDSLKAEFERYKTQVQNLEQSFNVASFLKIRYFNTSLHQERRYEHVAIDLVSQLESDESSGIGVWCINVSSSQIGSVRVRLCEVEFILIAFNTQLKIFHTPLDDHTSCEHS